MALVKVRVWVTAETLIVKSQKIFYQTSLTKVRFGNGLKI